MLHGLGFICLIDHQCCLKGDGLEIMLALY